MKFAVLASGQGSNFQAIIDAVTAGDITAELALVISDKRNAVALERAKKAGIKALHLNPKLYASRQSFDREVVIALKEEKIDFVVLAGYMLLLSKYFIKQYPNKILNIHPALLPSFKGAQGIKDAYTYGAKVTGATVHFVDDKMDHGAIIAQEAFKIKERESLESIAKRIHAIEHKMYPKVIQLFVQGRIKIKGRKVSILDKAPTG